MKKKELDTETAQQALPIKKRLLSLDALRGHHCSRNDSGQQCRRQSVVCTFTTFCMERTDTL